MDLESVIERSKNPGVEVPEPGDTVQVTFRVRERDRERTQTLEGVVLRVRGNGPQSNFTVRRMAAGNIGVERTFFLYSPLLDQLAILRRALVRRAKLFYLRQRTGRAARLRERPRSRRPQQPEETPPQPNS